MGLSNYKVRASIAVADMARAEEFYEGRLGLSAEQGQPDQSRVYACGGGSSLHVYASPDHAGKATATVASWSVPDLEAVVGELHAKGVEFAQYDEPATDENGIHTYGNHKVAWFKDPDGNTFAVDNGLPY
jgi:catechol 2,3-dioxygenase-like lactoylglutathione lyase family enzyme